MLKLFDSLTFSFEEELVDKYQIELARQQCIFSVCLIMAFEFLNHVDDVLDNEHLEHVKWNVVVVRNTSPILTKTLSLVFDKL